MSSQSLTTTTGAASTSESSVAPSGSSSSFRPSHTWMDPFPTASQASQTGTADAGNSLNSSASLYLYTFLATLVLLLGVSAAIVFRSLILRRRHRAMIDEAIRNGTWVPPTNGRGRRIDPSEKPLMHDAHLIVEAKYAHHEWDLMTPFSVSYSVPAGERVQAASPAPAPQPRRERIRGVLRHIWSHFSSSPAPPAPEPAIPLTPPPLPDASSGPLRVSVLIAMPSQNHNYAEHEELPHVEFGVAQVGVAAQESEQGKAGSLSDDAAGRV
ncbi:hypothetical protein BDZ89DRAFT_1071967 [Hymenopellis radicata]|nr:hypothetical protein BDZ89DRAFT_1071967 [Hymenopellis radicata]